MTRYRYTTEKKENAAQAVGTNLPISTKQAIEIANHLRGMPLARAKLLMEQVASLKKPIPFTRFTEGAGHKHGIGPGKYPVKACTHILALLNSVEANAQQKGLNTSAVVITHIAAQRGPHAWHYGRKRRIAMKRTHLEVMVEEQAEKAATKATPEKKKPARRTAQTATQKNKKGEQPPEQK